LLPIYKEESLVLNDRATKVKSILILHVRWWGIRQAAREFRLLEKIFVGIQRLVPKEFISFAVELVRSGLRAEVHHRAGKLAPLSAEVVVLDFELADRILDGNDHRQVDVTDVQRLAVKILGALIGERTSNLIIAPAEGVLPRRLVKP
jgi:hypothetical protein